MDTNTGEIKVVSFDPKNVLQSTPSFVWLIVIVGAILLVQMYVPAQFGTNGVVVANLLIMGLVMIARYLGVASQTIYTMVKMTGGSEVTPVPEIPGVTAAQAPVLDQPVIQVVANPKVRRVLL